MGLCESESLDLAEGEEVRTTCNTCLNCPAFAQTSLIIEERREER
jgi:hypothetical protein